jgi:hypothetical protein
LCHKNKFKVDKCEKRRQHFTCTSRRPAQIVKTPKTRDPQFAEARSRLPIKAPLYKFVLDSVAVESEREEPINSGPNRIRNIFGFMPGRFLSEIQQELVEVTTDAN